ncbi:MAG: 30S ribosomal protein S7 [Deferrisomatales bacterium]|nr:30S ribosomal protein S7 [Deferrisomatales bacterium]
MAFRKKEPRTVRPVPVRARRFRKVADARYGDEILGKLINKVMWDGKKSTAETIVYGALELVESKTSQGGLEVFHTALENIKPLLEVKSRRVGGSTYQVPVEVSPKRRLSLGIRWLVEYARARGEKTMRERLAGEILDAQQSRGGAVKKREDTLRMAEANKAFAHFRW